MYQRNILLDSEFHCQVTDFGLTRHSEATVAWTTKTFVPNYAAPELFGMCSTCVRPECKGCHQGHSGKTMETDVYAYGCLYYAVRLKHFLTCLACWMTTCTDILRCCSVSSARSVSNHETCHKWCTRGPTRKSKNGRKYLESHPELLETQGFGSSDDG